MQFSLSLHPRENTPDKNCSKSYNGDKLSPKHRIATVKVLSTQRLVFTIVQPRDTRGFKKSTTDLKGLPITRKPHEKQSSTSTKDRKTS